jgi:hypothetical protein
VAQRTNATAVESISPERGSRLVEIAVDGADTDAHRFYERHGYTDTEAGQGLPSFYYRRAIQGSAFRGECAQRGQLRGIQ